MKVYKTIVLSLLLMAALSSAADAKWWIFGQTEDEISIRYLYLNKVAFDESTTKISLYRDTLQEGMIHIRGKANVKSGKIADVRITLDEKKTWQKADLSSDGAFSFAFTPEMEKTYVIYVEITDTRGKTNDVEATRKEVSLSEENITGAVRAVLDGMLAAYMDENPQAFMAFVSRNFAGDDMILDRAIRLDFSAFDNINIRYNLNTVATDAKGMIYVSLTYNRMVISAKSGESFTDRGTTEFVFEAGSQNPLVFSMKNPLIFGLSLAAEVATGTVIDPGNPPVVVVDDRGNVGVLPLSEVLDGGSADNDAVESGNSISLIAPFQPPIGFTFADGDVAEVSGDFVITGGGEAPDFGYGFLQNGALIQDMGMVSLNDVTEAPASGYSNGTFGGGLEAIELYEGHTYAFQMSGPRYGLLYVRSVTYTVGVDVRMTLDYKYRADGLRSF